MKRYLLLIIVLSLLALWPFFKKGFFESHDGEWMVIRFTAFHQTLGSGQFPVRFVDRLNNNYGYPVLNFLYPLPFYFAEIPKIAGFNFVDSIKIVFIISTVISVAAMFWALSQIFEKRASFVGSIVYLFIPYRFVDLYVRGSLGENLAFTFVPLVAGSIFKVAKGSRVFLPAIAISVAGLILSHNVMAIIFLPFFLTMALILVKKDKLAIVGAFFLGILITTFFWLPALYDLRFVRFSQIDISSISDHLVNPGNLIIPSWSYGPTPNSPTGMSVQFGIVALAIFLSVFYLRQRVKTKNLLSDIFLIIFVLVFFLMTKFSLPFWRNLPFVDIIQFPWRLLSLIVFIAAFLAAYVINILQKKKTILAALIIAASVISTIAYTKPSVFINREDGFYSTNEDSTTVKDEYLPLWASAAPPERANQKIKVNPNQAIVNTAEIKPARYKAIITANDNTEVQVNSVYFPGWQAKVDNGKVPIDHQNKYGLITFNLPQGEHEVIIYYGRSSSHLVSEMISAVAILITGIFFYSERKNSNIHARDEVNLERGKENNGL